MHLTPPLVFVEVGFDSACTWIIQKIFDIDHCSLSTSVLYPTNKIMRIYRRMVSCRVKLFTNSSKFFQSFCFDGRDTYNTLLKIQKNHRFDYLYHTRGLCYLFPMLRLYYGWTLNLMLLLYNLYTNITCPLGEYEYWINITDWL